MREPRTEYVPQIILVMEDDPVIRELFTEAYYDHIVLTFDDGKEALQWIRDNIHLDVGWIIAGCTVKGSNGLHLLAKAGELQPHARRMLTGDLPEPDLRRLATRYRCNAWMTHPPDTERLRKIIPSTEHALMAELTKE